MSKPENFSESQQRLAALAKALAHPARIAILQQLSTDQGCRSTELDLPLARPTVAQHLAALAEAGLIRGSFSGRKLCYCLDREALRELSRGLSVFTSSLECPDEVASSCESGGC
ncbi:MAG: hypothetical protein RL095_79 [Verrucomicrobiota bacterium]